MKEISSTTYSSAHSTRSRVRCSPTRNILRRHSAPGRHTTPPNPAVTLYVIVATAPCAGAAIPKPECPSPFRPRKCLRSRQRRPSGTRSTDSMSSAAVRTTAPTPETPPGRPMTYVCRRNDHRRLEPVGIYAVRLLVRITRPLRKGVASGFSDLTRALRVSPPPATLVRYHNRTLGAGTSPWCASGGRQRQAAGGEIGTTQSSSAPTR